MDETIPLPVNPPPSENTDAEITRPTPVGQAPDGAQSFESPGTEETDPDPANSAQQGAQNYQAPHLPSGGEPPQLPTKVLAKRVSWPALTILSLLALLLVAAVSAYSGYRSGIELRMGAEATQVALKAKEQFDMGVQDIAEGRFSIARQRFEYVISLDPSYPGVTEKLADVLLELNTTATPTPAPTPTLTPTPDLRSVEELYNQGQDYLVNSDWTNAINTLLNLRKADPEFHAVELDGMLFLALRNRGRDKIFKEADLEGGLYDLSVAEKFGPLDSEAQGIRNWTRLYITGASFWEIDWEQAIFYFSQVAPSLPSLRDGSGMTATERYRVALFQYGNLLAQRASDDPDLWCNVLEQYELSLSLGPDPKVEEALAEANQNCIGISDEQDSDDDDDDDEDSSPPDESDQPPAEETPYPAPESDQPSVEATTLPSGETSSPVPDS